MNPQILNVSLDDVIAEIGRLHMQVFALQRQVTQLTELKAQSKEALNRD
jgi:hypothetical protein